MLLLRNRLLTVPSTLIFRFTPSPSHPPPSSLSFRKRFSSAIQQTPNISSTTNTTTNAKNVVSASNVTEPENSTMAGKTRLFVPPGVELDKITVDMVLPNSNIILGPYAGHSQIKQVEFIKSSTRIKDCPKNGLPEFAMLGRSNVGKSSLINALVRKKEVALTSKKPGKTQLINHFLVNKSWYIVDLPGYG
ncbi:hypothetical protein GIB67_036448 [Kingdonia uniflora]|uniref:EngB-type G domain-containing protein n=1 Tax=Kingdonia uniflora TaxID=39325 RepID=A0A7J7L447_9MAGN|nr:hypothetical protein GIB67_036448 [Kingdonia uniflora]